jgi:hypothetical protein
MIIYINLTLAIVFTFLAGRNSIDRATSNNWYTMAAVLNIVAVLMVLILTE